MYKPWEPKHEWHCSSTYFPSRQNNHDVELVHPVAYIRLSGSSLRGAEMRIVMRVGVLAFLLSLAGCDTSKITHSNEWECLESERLNFRDPDSVKFVANLGDRGEGFESGGVFWVRYSARNGFGGSVQASMKCITLPGGTKRFQDGETRSINNYRANRAKNDPDFASLPMNDQLALARGKVLDGYENLPELKKVRVE